MTATRKTTNAGNATIEVTFDDGTTAKVGGKRAARAAAVVVWRAGDWEARNEWENPVKPGWYVEGCRQSVYAAHSLANKIRNKPRWAGRPHDEVVVLVVDDAETIATN
jgi:hypothetical protein